MRSSGNPSQPPGEPIPVMSPEQFAVHLASLAAAEAARLQVQPPEREVVGVAVAGGVQVVISVSRDDGPARLLLRPGVELGAIGQGGLIHEQAGKSSPPAPPATPNVADATRNVAAENAPALWDLPSVKLRPVERAIMRAATAEPVKLDVLAKRTRRYWRRSGKTGRYTNSSYFRESVGRLLELGLLVRVVGGVKLGAKPADLSA